jgi:hypothetical protein
MYSPGLSIEWLFEAFNPKVAAYGTLAGPMAKLSYHISRGKPGEEKIQW